MSVTGASAVYGWRKACVIGADVDYDASAAAAAAASRSSARRTPAVASGATNTVVVDDYRRSQHHDTAAPSTIAALLDYETNIEDALKAHFQNTLPTTQILTPRVLIGTAPILTTPRITLVVGVTGTNANQTATRANTSQDYDSHKLGTVQAIGTTRRDGTGQSLGTIRGNIRQAMLQADQLVDTAQASIGPEPGVTYSARLLRADTEAEIQAVSGVSTATAVLSAPYDGQVIIELWAVRAGLASL